MLNSVVFLLLSLSLLQLFCSLPGLVDFTIDDLGLILLLFRLLVDLIQLVLPLGQLFEEFRGLLYVKLRLCLESGDVEETTDIVFVNFGSSELLAELGCRHSPPQGLAFV